MPLVDVVTSASLVVLASPAHPQRSVVQIPIEGEGYDGEKCPPFAKGWLHYDVKEVLCDQTGLKVAPGQMLKVAEADWQFNLELHMQYRLEGLSMHPIIECYHSREFTEDEARLVLAYREGDELVLSVLGAEVAIEDRAEVEAILGETKKDGPS